MVKFFEFEKPLCVSYAFNVRPILILNRYDPFWNRKASPLFNAIPHESNNDLMESVMVDLEFICISLTFITPKASRKTNL